MPGFSRESIEDAERSLMSLLAGSVCSNDIAPSAHWAFDCALHELDCGPLIPCVHQGSTCPLLIGGTDEVVLQWRRLSKKWRRLSKNRNDRLMVAKIKLGRQSLNDDIHMMNTLFHNSKNTRFRLDANRAWTFAQATEFSNAICWDRIDFLEEPCQSSSDSVRLTRNKAVKLALDESLREEGFNIPASGIAALVLKPGLQPGGWRGVKNYLDLARAQQLQLVISSSYQSSLGLNQLAAIAERHMPNVLPGLDTGSVFSAELIRPWCDLNDLPVVRPLLNYSALELRWKGFVMGKK